MVERLGFLVFVVLTANNDFSVSHAYISIGKPRDALKEMFPLSIHPKFT